MNGLFDELFVVQVSGALGRIPHDLYDQLQCHCRTRSTGK